MIRTSLIGYKKKTVEEAVAALEKSFNAQMEEVQNSINAANSEKSEMMAKVNMMPTRIEKARVSASILEEYQDNMRAIINALRTSMDEANQKKMSETTVFRQDVEKQINILDERIEILKERVRDLVQSMTFLGTSQQETAEEDRAWKVRVDSMINDFRERADVEQASEVPVLHAGSSELVFATAEDEKAAQTADTHGITAELRIENITEEDTIRADNFMSRMRQNWMAETEQMSEPGYEEDSTLADAGTSALRAKLFSVAIRVLGPGLIVQKALEKLQ